MSNKMEFLVECTKTGYSSYAVKYPIATTGRDLHELKANIVEAVGLYFAESGRKVTEAEVKLTIDLPQFFEYHKVINVEALSDRIGMDKTMLQSYINGVRKPTANQTEKILKGIQKIGQELAEISFLF
ncbi:MAG: helix-turn-helix transcriptional regulator [Bacteroidota bacterium]